MTTRTLGEAEQVLKDLQHQNTNLNEEFQAVPKRIASTQAKIGDAFKDGLSTSKMEKEILALIKHRDKFPQAMEELNYKIDVAKQEVMDLRRSEAYIGEKEEKNSADAQALEIVKLMKQLRELFIAQHENENSRERYESFPQFTETIERTLAAISVLYPELADEAALELSLAT